ncbi:MAG: hypothetical protein KAX20_06905 [Candidatus Omnitrophica bacterium]|nr:hypothetical protein [Candidatus Omnitrophota bacterium]
MQIKDKNKIISLAGVLVFLLFFQFFLVPTFRRTKRLNKRLKHTEKELSEIKGLKKKYLTEKDYFDLAKKKDFSFYSLIEKFAESLGIRKNIISLRPVSSPLSRGYKSVGFEIRLEKIDLKDLTQFLTKIESSPYPISINRLLIEQDKGPGLLKATVELVTVQEVL